MEALNKLFTEQDVNAVAGEILLATKDKLIEQIETAFYDVNKDYLYNIYDNNKDRIKRELIREISEEFVREPDKYDMKSIRDKMWSEHKTELLSTLTDEMVKANVEGSLGMHTSTDYYWHWQWKDAIVGFILKNWDILQNDERISSGLVREIEKLKRTNNRLSVELYEATHPNEEE